MEWKLTEDRMKQYSQALTSAQETEQSIGSLTYKLFKFSKMREEIDDMLKAWWDSVLEEMKLDKKRNYMITRDGIIQDVTPKEPETQGVTGQGQDAPKVESKVGSNVADLL